MSKDFFIWNDSYSVANNIIDEQHKRLIGIINRLYQSFMDKNRTEEISEIMKELTEYTQYHFSTEEEIMYNKRYPGIADHIKEHEYFKNELDSLKVQFEESPEVLTLKIMTFLQKWLKDHILVVDKRLGAFLVV